MDFTFFLEPFSYPFMLRALITILVLAAASGVVGLFINLRSLEFISDGLVHSVFPGLVVGFVVGGTDALLPGALVAGVIAAAILTVVSRRGVGSDAAIAVVLAGSFSLGVVIVSRGTNYVSQLEQLLFGAVLTVTVSQLWQIIIISAFAILLVGLTWRRQLFLSFDRSGFRTSGYRVLPAELLLNCSVAFLVVAGSQALGNLLVLAFLIVPVAIARLMTTRLGLLTPIALVVAGVSGWLGLLVSFHASVSYGLTPSPGSVIVIVLIAIYAVVLLSHLVILRSGVRAALKREG
ncbi:metal ABC transporter permease [Lysinibacter sp. HNR]|uniref:metal ABC transporter permease n=1 Tax=Lysinibacter sp. HNR TaxID=3031408 RepID=UPI0024356E96|nr:metal ABC transporter permease [Lysinibacter sp. HNR]WGD37237.1 metal ABC transporter permease [Lysinibacter sp. HNR]